MIFSSVGLFLFSSTLHCVVTATRPSQHWSEALISTLDTNGSAEDGWREVHVKAAGTLTPFEANVFEERGLEPKLEKEEHFKAADPLTPRQTNHSEDPDSKTPDASGATLASQLAVSLLVKQSQFYVEENERSPNIIFTKGKADSLNIDYFRVADWEMSAGNPSHFGYMYRGREWAQLHGSSTEWELFDVKKALEFFVAPRNRPAIEGRTEPFLVSGVHNMGGNHRNLALVFGYVNFDKEELPLVKFLYLAQARSNLDAGDFKACESFDEGSRFRPNLGEPRWQVFGKQNPYGQRRNPLLEIQCGYTLKPTR